MLKDTHNLPRFRCIVDGCERRHSGHGYCQSHWQRILKNGDPIAHVPIKFPVVGRTKDGDGRVYIYSPNHPHADRRKYVYRHRLVMEAHLGRYLLPTEIVHHKNRDITDDRIENLELLENQAAHVRLHAKERREHAKS